ncbi:MAG: YceI family protein, partial [Thermoanaerobaculia bacterium]
PGPDPSRLYRILASESRIGFSISKWRILRKEGRFRDFRGEVSIDWKSPSASRIDVTIEAASLDTHDRHRDETVRSDDFLDAASHPTLRFESRRISPLGRGLYEVAGDLTIRGVTRSVKAPVRVTPGARPASVMRFAGSFRIRRTDFGVNGTRWSGGKAILGDEVTIALDLVAVATTETKASR